MANDTVTLAASGTATLVPRWMCVNVVNDSGVVAWVSTNGVTPSGTGANDGEVQVANGASVVLTNQLPIWNQSQSVIANGANNQWSQALEGQAANPGTVVKVVMTSPTGSLTVAGCG
jgi:hypothetical protein